MTIRRIALVAGCAVLIVACSDKSNTAAPGTSASSQSSVVPATFAGAVCGAVLGWQNRMVDAANAFSSDSPNLDVPARRVRYSRAFDDQKAITHDLRKDIEAAPADGVVDAEAIRSVLVAATGDVQTTLNVYQAEAASHPDSDYEFQAVKEDRLFAGTEKSLSHVLKSLNEQSRVRNVHELGGTCGRT